MYASDNYIGHIFWDFMTECYKEINYDEQLMIRAGFVQNSGKNSITIQLEYNRNDPLRDYRLAQLQRRLETVAGRYELMLASQNDPDGTTKNYEFSTSPRANIENRLN